MSRQEIDVVRAWTDDDYLAGLSREDRAQVPAKPERADQMSDQELRDAAGTGWPLVAAVAGGIGAVAGGVGEGLSTWDDNTDDPNGPG